MKPRVRDVSKVKIENLTFVKNMKGKQVEDEVNSDKTFPTQFLDISIDR